MIGRFEVDEGYACLSTSHTSCDGMMCPLSTGFGCAGAVIVSQRRGRFAAWTRFGHNEIPEYFKEIILQAIVVELEPAK